MAASNIPDPQSIIDEIQRNLDELAGTYKLHCTAIIGNPSGAPIEIYGRGLSYLQMVACEPKLKTSVH